MWMLKGRELNWMLVYHELDLVLLYTYLSFDHF